MTHTHAPDCGFHLHMSLDECNCSESWAVAHEAIRALRAKANDTALPHSERVVAMCAVRDIETAIEHIGRLRSKDAPHPA